MGVRHYLVVTAVLFIAVGGLHFLRVVNGWAFQFGPLAIPTWLSWAATLIPWALAAWALRLARR